MWSRGVDTQRFHPRHRDLQMRTRLSGGQPEKNLLLYAGRLAPEKQVETLLPRAPKPPPPSPRVGGRRSGSRQIGKSIR